nr:substrate-binding domain-containing protein [Echinimonas agarilytica]
MLAQKFRSNESKTIVVLVPDIANVFFAKVISGIENVAQQSGYSVLLGDTKDSSSREKSFIQMVETRLADGIINLRPHTSDSALPQEGICAVSATSSENTPYPSVRIDNVGASAEVVKYLLSLGHQRIGVISGLTDNPHAIDRLKGYRSALADADIPYTPDLIVEGDFNYASGLSAVDQFLAMSEPPTAIFCMNDEMAIAAIKGISDRGLKVPEDISVTGFDDMDVSSYCRPPLTSVAQPAEQIGERSAEMIIRMLRQSDTDGHEYVMPHRLIIRQSTAIAKLNPNVSSIK